MGQTTQGRGSTQKGFQNLALLDEEMWFSDQGGLPRGRGRGKEHVNLSLRHTQDPEGRKNKGAKPRSPETALNTSRKTSSLLQ